MMRTRSKLLLAALTAALALTLGAATANAARSFSITNNALLTYVSPSLTLQTGSDQIICAVTLTASLHVTGAKTRDTLVGFVNGGRGGSCRNTFTTPTNDPIILVSHRFPWHIKLISFRGTLPRITEVSVRLERARFLISFVEPIFRAGLLACLYEGEARVTTRGRTGAAEYTVELLISDETDVYRLLSEALNQAIVPCPETGNLRGVFHANLPPIIRLI